jgi:AraC family transcriptional regulator
MQTRIDINLVGPDVPGGGRSQIHVPPTNPSKISILNGFARDFAIRETHGAFSLKWIPKGAARYRVDRAQHQLSGDRVLLLHAGQPYEVEFLDRGGTESFSVFFSERIFKDALADRQDHPALRRLVRSGDVCDPLYFADMVFRPPIELGIALRRLRHSVCKLDGRPERLEEMLLSLLTGFITISQDHQRMAENVPAKRATTRRLLLGRLQRAKEMIEDVQGRPQPLDDLAQATSLSKFHFLRLFKATFEVSPLEYADRCRVERGKDLLRRTRLPVGQVAARLGYESQSAFAKMFRRHTGVTPRAFRSG